MTTKPYNDYNSYLRRIYGKKVYRIGIDAGFTCPNRDGTKGTGGCIYCNETGSRSPYTEPEKSVSEQLSSRIGYLKDRFGADKFIAYFQAFTNTYAPIEKLKSVYDAALPFDGVIGISVGTRPDCVDKEKISLLSSYSDRYEVWVEYGLQSVRNDILSSIARGHTFEDFTAAVKLSKAGGIKTCAHIILGLPGETVKDAVAAARTLTDMRIEGVKIHVLHILKGSKLEDLYSKGGIKIPGLEEYASMVCGFLENLSPDIVVQRLTGQGQKEEHIAPAWALDKTATIKAIEDEFERRKTRQGAYCARN